MLKSYTLGKENDDIEEIKMILISVINNHKKRHDINLLVCLNPIPSFSIHNLKKLLAFLSTNLELEVFETEYKGYCPDHLKSINR